MVSRLVASRLLAMLVCLAVATPVVAGFASTDAYLVSTGRGPGSQGSQWYTTVWVHNPNDTDAAVRFFFLERDRSNTSPIVSDDTVSANSVRTYNDVVTTLFGVERFGAIRVVSDVPVVVVSRIFSQTGDSEGDSVGQFLGGVPASFAIGLGEATDLVGVRQHTPAASWNFRYNYGLVETAGESATVRITAFHQNAGLTAETTVVLRPYEAKQWNVADLLDGGRAWNWRLHVEVVGGAGKVIAFGSGIANGSNDPSTFEMQFRDALLADGPGGLTLPFTGSADADGRAAFDVTNTSAASGSGIAGRGGRSGGEFSSTDGSATATLGLSDTGGTGIWAVGNQEGGYFQDADGTGQAWVARGDRGIEAMGSGAGGAFWTPDDVSLATVATTTSGIEAFGPEQGGVFGDTDQTSWASVAQGNAGISATGDEMGGWFSQTDGDSQAYVASGGSGIVALGEDTGGYFHNTTDESAAHLGHNGFGVEGFGEAAGGSFTCTPGSATAVAADGDRGVTASGDEAGGRFEDLDDGTWTTVAEGAATIAGNGTKSFVQNHPDDPTRVIVYTAIEGDEVGTYTRGSARLAGGEARVVLGETFRWVTNPDLGLTVHLTPVGSWSQLYVADRSTRELVVRSAGGDPEARFDYVVMGLRIGFEESSVVQERRVEAPIPSMASAEERYRREPELYDSTARARFEAMQRDVGEPSPADLSRSEALAEAIGRAGPERSETSSEGPDCGPRGRADHPPQGSSERSASPICWRAGAE